MKKFLISLVLAGAACGILRAESQTDVRISFSTKGPDKYADQTSVLSNEFYALAWSAKGCDFYGFNADGTLVSNGVNEVIAMYPRARRKKKDPTHGYLPSCQAAISTQRAAKLANGTLYVVMLDTRKADRTLSQQEGNDADGWTPKMVKGYTNVVCSAVESAVVSASLNIDADITVSVPSAVPAGTLDPVVKRVSFRDEPSGRKLVICVTNTVSFLSYLANAQAVGGTVPVSAETSAADGRETPEDEIEIVVPASEAKGFFKVVEQH